MLLDVNLLDSLTELFPIFLGDDDGQDTMLHLSATL